MDKERLIWALGSAAGCATAGVLGLVHTSLLLGVTAAVLALTAGIVTFDGLRKP